MKIFIRIIALISVLAFPLALKSQTIIPGGYVSGNWDAAHSPYQVEGNLLVHPDSTLETGPGTKILFRGDYRLEVLGQLLVSGTSSQPVFFDRDNDTTEWRGIWFNNTDTSMTDSSILAHGNIRNCLGGSGLTLVNSDRVRVSFFNLDHCSTFQGGAIRCAGSDARFENLLVESNIALDGAGITLDHSDAVLDNCTIRNNHADGAGGGMVIFNGSSPLLENCEISDNYSFGSGGGIYINGSEPVFIRCDFKNNYGAAGGGSFYTGGGVAVKLQSDPYFENCIFIENLCNSSGGGIASFSPNSLINCLFENNSAPVSGGAVFISSGNPVETKLFNNTFLNNDSPDGSVIYAHNHVAVVKNCIAWQDNPPDTSSLFCLDAYMALEALDVSYSDLKNGQEGIELSGNASVNYGPGNISFDPVLDPETQDLVWNSPCIEAGTPDTSGLMLPELDLAGNPRFANERVDMGAIEYQLPLIIQNSAFNIQHSLKVFPNPARERVYVEMVELKHYAAYQLLNTQGELVLTGMINAGQNTVEINIADLAEGLYFLRITGDDFHFAGKLIKIN